jgi:lipoate-protein ligase A
MTGPAAWLVEHHRGTALQFHARPLPEPVRRSVWWFAVDRPAVVLGSAQPDDVVDRDAVERMGAELVRRRSGGGAVLIAPGDLTWVDLIIPAGDPLWHDDVGRAFDWLGDAWGAALTDLGVADPQVHRGRMRRNAWSDLVCFAGLGRGEITVDGRKVLGISQRRTRGGARFQCALLHRWDPVPLLDVLVLSTADRRRATVDLAEVAAGVAARVGPRSEPSDGADALQDVLLRHLPH